jgi:hypothetical protein
VNSQNSGQARIKLVGLSSLETVTIVTSVTDGLVWTVFFDGRGAAPRLGRSPDAPSLGHKLNGMAQGKIYRRASERFLIEFCRCMENVVLWPIYLRTQVATHECQNGPNRLVTASRFHKLSYPRSPLARSQHWNKRRPPSHAQNDDLSVEVPSFEHILDRDEPLHLFIFARHPRVCTRPTKSGRGRPMENLFLAFRFWQENLVYMGESRKNSCSHTMGKEKKGKNILWRTQMWFARGRTKSIDLVWARLNGQW